MDKKILGYISLAITLSIWGVIICWYKIELVLLLLVVSGDLFFTIAVAFLGKDFLLKAKRHFKIYWRYLVVKSKKIFFNL
jgi:hypothetical protein